MLLVPALRGYRSFIHRAAEKGYSRKPPSPRSHRLTPSGAHPSNISQLLLVCIHTNLEDYYALGWGKGRLGVTMPPLRAYAKKNSPEGLRVEEGVRRRFRKSEGVRT